MIQDTLFEAIPHDKLDLITKEELNYVNNQYINVIKQITKFNNDLLLQLDKTVKQELALEEQLVIVKNKLFGKSSEKSLKDNNKKIKKKTSKKRKQKIQLPSLRYGNLDIEVKEIELKHLPGCSCCGNKMKDSGLVETSEVLKVKPKKFYIERIIRHKYNCGSCHSNIKTAPNFPMIKPMSTYSDDLIIDVSMTKYCDLLPITRYTKIAERAGVPGLPANSLIQCTHNLANFVKPAYDALKVELMESKVLHADETPHRMLEGSEKSNWYLWGFSTKKTSFFEIHNTRSGNIASEILKDSKCEFLVSDVFSGYAKAVRVTNEYRKNKKMPKILNIYCNAHARRKFVDSSKTTEIAFEFINLYKYIYHLESRYLDCSTDKRKLIRKKQLKYFIELEQLAIKYKGSYSTKSSIGKAISYFLKNYYELTYFLKRDDIPIDNNPQERQLRSPVIGRKTWLGTHSIRGSKTTAIIFSLVESCKLNKINPRIYFKELVENIHLGKNPITPKEWAENTKI